jgi:hypothetical protein
MKKNVTCAYPPAKLAPLLKTAAINPRLESTRPERAFRSADHLSTWQLLYVIS